MNKDNYVDPCSRAAYVGKREKIKPVDEYIKREAVIKGFTDLLQKPGDIYPTDITTMMQRIPAEEVRPVARGEWKEYGEPNQRGEYELWYWKCSICGAIACHDEYNFCPNCGADMRGK